MLIDSGTQSQINVTDAQQEIVASVLNLNNGLRAVVYYSLADLNNTPVTTLIMRTVDAGGTSTGVETIFPLPASGFSGGLIDGFEIVALSNGNFAVVYNDDGNTGPSSNGTLTAVRFQLYGSTGAAIGGPVTIATGQAQTFVFSSTVVTNPGGGFDVAIFESGTSFDIDLFNVSNAGVVGPEIQTSGLAGKVAYTPTGGRITANNAGNGYTVDFPGSSPPVAYSLMPPNGSSLAILDSYLRAESATSAVVAFEYTTRALNSSAIQSRSIQLVRFTDGQSAQLLSTITLPAGTQDSDSLSDFIILADGSFVVGYFTDIPNGLGTTELRHISSSGALLGAAELLNPAGSGAGAVQLTQLADGRVMAAYSGITAATGSDIEVFRELFTVTGPSTTPTNGPDSLTGTAGNDTINGLDGNDTINGLDGNDLLSGGNGDDSIDGGLGNDNLTGGAGRDRLVGGVGNDTMFIEFGDSALGGDGDDLIVLTGTVYSATQGNGGAGQDTLDASGAGGSLTNWTTETVEVMIGTNFSESITALSGTLAGNRRFEGRGGNDTLVGEINNDTLFGGDGADDLVGGAGNDILWGGTENDRLFGDDGNDILLGETGSDQLFGWNGADAMYGWEGNDTFYGDAGNDTLFGEQGNDLIIGGADNDLLFGGIGFDTLFGEAGDDTLLGETGEDLLWGGDGADVLFGWEWNDTLFGEAGNDTLFGEQDNDVLYGWVGADLLWGGDGNDTLWGEQDNDTLLGEAGNDVLLGVDGNDVMYGWIGNDTLYGWTGADVLWGEAGNDLMLGEDGDDIFIGGLGRDTMTGGQGVDQFFNANFEIAAGEVDLITDFDAADRYLFQTGAQIQYFNFNAPGYGTGAGIHVQVQGGVFILDVLGANASQLQAQTLFF